MSTERMTSKERLLATMAGAIPDRVPVQLGITNMFSVYQQNHIGWDAYADNKVPLWKLVVDTHRLYGLDGYLYLGIKEIPRTPGLKTTTAIIERTEDKLIRRTDIETPEGNLRSEETIFKNESPTTTQGLVKTEKDFELWLKYCVRGDSDYDASVLREPMEYLGQDGVACGEVGIPGLAQLAGVFEGKLAPATYFYFDHPEAIQRYREKIEKALLRKLEFTLESGVDYVQLGSSGMLTLSNLEIFRELCLPFMKKASALCRQAGKLCEVHCCGKARQVVEACYEETDVDCINPLQPPPMGDCDLAELKRLFGHRLCLKGNVGVTDPLLFGTPDAVEKDVVRCMEAAKEGGRYILFSEEGIGALTPAENVRRYVEVGKSLGKY